MYFRVTLLIDLQTYIAGVVQFGKGTPPSSVEISHWKWHRLVFSLKFGLIPLLKISPQIFKAA